MVIFKKLKTIYIQITKNLPLSVKTAIHFQLYTDV